MKKYSWIIACLLIAGLALGLAAFPAQAQATSQITIDLNKVVGLMTGYTTGSITAQGTLALTAQIPAGVSVTKVSYYIDGNLLGETTQAPYRLQFTSDAYPAGMHAFTAAALTTDRKQVGSNTINANLITGGQSWLETLKILGPILLIVLVVAGVSMFVGRKPANVPAGARRDYGAVGGAICSRCGRPFAISFFTLRLVAVRLDRCPYCGKIGLVRARSMAELRAAEAAEIKDAAPSMPAAGETPEEKLRRELDNSRFKD